MGGIFSSTCRHTNKRKNVISESDRAVLDLKNARDRLRKYEAKLASESEYLTSQARELLRTGKRDRALLLVKLRRLREARLGDVDAQLLKLEEMVNTIEWENQQSVVLDSLRRGNDALNAMQSLMSLEAVEQLMDETRDAIDAEEKISAVLAGATLSATAEDEVLTEFKQLEQQQQQQEASEAPVAFPEAPSTKPDVGLQRPAAVAAEEPPPPPRVAVPA